MPACLGTPAFILIIQSMANGSTCLAPPPQLAEMLQPHSLAGLKAVLSGSSSSSGNCSSSSSSSLGTCGEALVEAARAQALRTLSLQVSIG
jgi:hypothetical protein